MLRIYRDERGQSLVFVSVFIALVATGFLALAVDVGTLFREKRVAQSAADAAALAAAEEANAGDSASEQAAADAIATLNGFDTSAATNPAVVTLTTPASGNFTGSSYVQASVTMPVKTLFMSAFNSKWSTISVTAASIAGGGSSSQTCVCLDGTSGQDLYMSNGSKIVGSGCGVVEDSNASNAIGIIGGADLDPSTLGTVSTTWDNASNINNGGSINASTTIVQGITTKCAGTMPPAPTYSSCVGDPGGGSSNFTAGPASASSVICYTGLTVGANNTADTLKPGIYVVTGYLHFESGTGGHSNLGGNGVFFYLPGTASLTIDNGANVNLVSGGSRESGGTTAPTVGVYNGILVYQPASNTSAIAIQGGATVYMNGSILAPGAAMSLANGTGSTVDGGIVASSLTMAGGGTLNANANLADEGSLSLSYPTVVQ